ncbi:seven-hairpin glycosidase [Auricularia subglabra TFB-10046 SS5]|nr:seven-hairpin glycosidase [Auricularia subglabra TFB-10046 SS5]
MRTAGFATLALYASLASAGAVQLKGLRVPKKYQKDKQAVKKIFEEAFAAYEKFAWGHDDVRPVSETFLDSRNGWGASIVDALGTMKIMGLESLYKKGLNYTANIDFSVSKIDSTVSVFETTIRYIGGMLSAYELGGRRDKILVKKAQEVADKLAYAWVGDNAMPYGFVNFTNNVPRVANSNIAEAGTLILEWARLSEYTHNKKYVNLVDKSMRAIATNEDTLLPGLAGQGVNPTEGTFSSRYISWGGASDSYFEYLIKYARLTNNKDKLWVRKWKQAIDSSIKYLAQRTTVGNWLIMADMDEQKRIRHVNSHLACFVGGNFIMGGRLLNNNTIFKTGLELTDGCTNTYSSTATGIGPEGFAFIGKDGNYTGRDITPEQIAFNDKHGFYIRSSAYILRPEVMESNFYAWRATGNTKYLDNAAAFVKQLQARLRQKNGGYAGINNVDDVNTSFIDDTESFFFAEVVKYLYLTFDDPEHISLDKWVFNTEAHPLLAPAALPSYDVDNHGHGPW